MKPSYPSRVAIAAFGFLALPATAPAQSGWEFNGHGAVFVNDVFAESGTGIQAGVRLLRHTESGVAIGGNLDFAQVASATFGDGVDAVDLDATFLLYSVELDYVFPRRSRTQALVGAGIGGVSTSFSEQPEDFGESTTGTLVPVGFGLLFHSDPVRPRWSFRIDVRDNLIAVDTRTPDGDGLTQEMRSNWELSAGFSVRFGAPAPEPGPVVEEPDRRPPPVVSEPAPEAEPEIEPEDELPVDQEGEPGVEPPGAEPEAVPVVGDTDRDGVVDTDDRCANTPRGAEVDDRGCPVEPEPVEPALDEDEAADIAPAPAEDVACLATQAWFAGERPIDVLERTWRPVGGPEPITFANLVRVAEHDGVPVYVAEFEEEPYRTLWLPLCEPDTYQAYVPAE